MAEPAATDLSDLEPDVSHLVTEDDVPVDNFYQDKQMDILTEALRVSWPEGRPFLSASDVGIFYAVKEAIVPDVFLSVGVEVPEDFMEKNRRSYFMWLFGKPPEVVIEIVSNRQGGEETEKYAIYAQIKVPYYVIYDPQRHLGQRPLRIFQLSGASYVEKVDRQFPELGLGLTIWSGVYDGIRADWLRWIDGHGRLLETGPERAARGELETEQERNRAEQERNRAEQERERAEQERERAEQAERSCHEERLRRETAERKLRELGIDPEDL